MKKEIFFQKREGKELKRKLGFTLIEVLISVAITSMAVVFIFTLFNRGNALFQQEIVLLDLQQNVRLAMDGMSREIRQATPLVNVSITGIPGNNMIQFNVIGANQKVAYFLNGSNQIIRQNPPGGADKILAHFIGNLTFSLNTNVITLGINATKTDNKGRVLIFSLNQKVRLRNE
ncbi:MAG: prepilin-type N-terminal cleavage/methylation domain-containing protein [Omnitrophica bacterium]|nr:prepilin-type N-terminal cleavage/methylation domain-containing protein [Candidatus Omnitrophota bacterium]